MATHRQLAGRITVGLLVIVLAAACSRFGPQLSIIVHSTAGPREVTLTVEESGLGSRGSEDFAVLDGERLEVTVPLGSTWEVTVDGRHAIGSGDRAGLALPSAGQGQDVVISMRVARDGTVQLVDAP
jgi:hypothetical protein